MQFQDITSLIGLFVAIFAVMVIPFIIYLDSSNKKIKLAHEQLNQAFIQLKIESRVNEETMQSISELTQSLKARGEFLGGMIESLLIHSKTDTPRLLSYNRSMLAFERNISTAMNDLLLFSSNEKTRFSAHQKIADSLGNLESLEKMALSAKKYPNTAEQYQSSIKTLKSRLNARN